MKNENFKFLFKVSEFVESFILSMFSKQQSLVWRLKHVVSFWNFHHLKRMHFMSLCYELETDQKTFKLLDTGFKSLWLIISLNIPTFSKLKQKKSHISYTHQNLEKPKFSTKFISFFFAITPKFFKKKFVCMSFSIF